MYGFKSKAQREREQSLHGGMIEGPGTGTSDSIKAKIPRGSYIMPADSTKEIGPEALAQMGARGFKPGVFDPNALAASAAGQGFGFKPRTERVDARVSNGEYQLPPEQVHAVGAQVLDQMKGATHTPAGPRGFKPKEAELFFADGGAVRAPGIGFKPGSRPAPTQEGPRLGFGPTSVGARILAGSQAFADGGVVESTDDLIARISAKYGTGAAPAEKPQSAAPAQRPAERPAPAPTISSAADAIRARRQQINEAAGYADGGLVDEDEQSRTVPGAPGVQRTGNSYSDAPPAAPAPTTPTQAPSATTPQQRTPTFGETQNRINDERAERTGTGLYGTPRDPAQRPSGPGIVDQSFPNTKLAIQGAGDNIAEANQRGGLPAAAGAVVRNTMVPAIGLAADVGRGIKQVLDPPANALKTAVTGDPTPIGQAPGLAGANTASANSAANPPRNVPNRPNGTAAAHGATTGFGDWQAGASLQDRDAAADVYRDARQQQTPGGMRNASTNATTLYNAEQQVRGTGVTARRGANGVMEFSGDGANALPQSHSQSVDLNAGNASMARTNAVRQEYLNSQAASDGGPRGGVIRDTSADEANATLGRWGQERAIQRAIDSGNPRVMEGVARLVGNTGERYATDAQIASRDRNAAADRTQRGEIAAAGFDIDRARAFLEQRRLGLDERRADGEFRAQGFQARGLERLENLQTQYEQAKTPEQRAQLAEQIRVLTGREAPNRYTVVPGGQELTEQGMRTVPSRVLNNQTGQFVEQPAIQQQPAAPQVGEVRGGYRFTGGNPADQSSWQKV